MDNMGWEVRNCYIKLLIFAIFVGTSVCKPHSNRYTDDINIIGIKSVLHEAGQRVRILPRHDFCAYNNQTYEAGARFQPDPCTHCHCPRHGGRIQCFIQDCRHMANCIRYTKRADQCCGLCEQVGCQHTNGKSYRPREVVQLGPCERCQCPLTGGKLQCDRVRCPQVACVNPVKQSRDCCETCPNGPNCYLGNLIIPAEPGKRYHVDRCKVCQCPEAPIPFWLRGRLLQAVCESIC